MAYSKGMGNLNAPAKTKFYRLVTENLFMAGKVNGSDLQEHVLTLDESFRDNELRP